MLKEVGSKLSSYSKDDYVLYEGIKTRYNRLELLSLNQIDNTSYKHVYDFFHQQHQFEQDLNDPNIEEISGKFALLIGNSEYAGNKLQSPINDINVIESKLVEMIQRGYKNSFLIIENFELMKIDFKKLH